MAARATEQQSIIFIEDENLVANAVVVPNASTKLDMA
jgi:hypothetical protein